MTSIILTPIGSIRTPYRTLEECPRNVGALGVDPATERCRIELAPAYAKGLLDIERASHVWVLYWLDRADRSLLTVTTPYDGKVRGVFATRSPARPNPIAMLAVRLYGVEPGAAPSLIVSGMDCLDGTPLLDLKLYSPAADRLADASVAWMKV
ncbi:MAG: tRNA (N6-threonylcarbamoyladenosine(37)-N6)-methyltransferase TrmO [Roseiarcus sp.]